MIRNPDKALQLMKGIVPNNHFRLFDQLRKDSVELEGKPEKGWVWADVMVKLVGMQMGPLAVKAMMQKDSATLGVVVCSSTLTLWRLTKGCYEFDSTLLDHLSETEVTKIPLALLENLPEYVVYVPLNGRRLFRLQAEGVFMGLSEFRDGRKQLRFVVWTTDGELLNHTLALTSDDLKTCLDDSYVFVEQDRAVGIEGFGFDPFPKGELDPDILARSRRDMEFMVSVFLYLCSEEPDVSGVPRQPQAGGNKAPVGRFFAPDMVQMLQVGFKHGGKIRMWQEKLIKEGDDASSGLGMPKPPTWRKAHWHLYWTGVGRLVPRIRWIQPTPINMRGQDMDNFPVSLRPVLADPADQK